MRLSIIYNRSAIVNSNQKLLISSLLAETFKVPVGCSVKYFQALKLFIISQMKCKSEKICWLLIENIILNYNWCWNYEGVIFQNLLAWNLVPKHETGLVRPYWFPADTVLSKSYTSYNVNLIALLHIVNACETQKILLHKFVLPWEKWYNWVCHDRHSCQIIWQISTQGRAKKICQKLHPVGYETRTSRSSGQCLTNQAKLTFSCQPESSWPL